MNWTEEQREAWGRWLSERPEAVRAVAERISPEYRYRRKGDDATGNYFVPVSYEEGEDGSVTITCIKHNDNFPPLGGYGVFGMKADDLEPIEP